MRSNVCRPDDYDEALQAFDGILAEVPRDPVTLTSKGHALKTRGRYDAAVESYHAPRLPVSPSHGEAYYSLANLKVYAFGDEELQQMLRQDENPRPVAPGARLPELRSWQSL